MEALRSLAHAPASGLAAPLLSVTSISKSWGSKVVLDDIDLHLAGGSTTWLGGANGAGKTTFLRVVCGLLKPNDGGVSFDGLHPRRDKRAFQKRLGFLSAGDRGLYARLTAGHHLYLWARLALLPEDQVEPALQRVIQHVGLQEFLPLRADRMSMGQRQRLRIAMTFLHSPDLVLLDEPLTSLDEAGAEALRRCIDDVLDRSGAVLWCSPGPDCGYVEFDRQLWLEDGKLTDLE